MLARAIESVLAQDFSGWELIISDDESPAGAAREIAEAYARRDPRIAVSANPGPKGQSGNMNAALSLARGRWIKPLHDDDVLEPSCLSRMLNAAGRGPNAAIVSCLARKVENGKCRTPQARGRRASVEELDTSSAYLAMYLADLDIGVPTQVLVRASAVRAAGPFPSHPAITTGVDVLWYIDLLRHGSIVMLNETLVRHHQDGHDTITSRTSESEFYRECAMLREVLLPAIDADEAPSLAEVRQMIRLIRAMWCTYRGRPFRGAALASTCWRPVSWYLAVRWLLRRSFPGVFEAVPRRVLAP